MQVGTLVRHVLYKKHIGIIYQHIFDDKWLVQWNDGVRESINSICLEVVCK